MNIFENTVCYYEIMDEDDLIAYQARWQAVTEIQGNELRQSSIETKSKKLNSVINLTRGLGIFKVDRTAGVIYHK